MLADDSIEYVDELCIEFHSQLIGVSGKLDGDLLKKIKKRGVRIGAMNKPTGRWFDGK